MPQDTTKSFGVPLGGARRGGITLPQAAYKFRVVPRGVSEPAKWEFMTNVISYKLDLANKTLSMRVRQGTVGSFNYACSTLDAMNSVVLSHKIPVLETLDGGNDNVLMRVILEGDRDALVSHTLEFNYELQGTAEHVMEWKFTNVRTENWEPEPTPEPPVLNNTEVMTPAEAMVALDALKDA